MVLSQNGWVAITSGLHPNLTPLRWVTGKVRAGDVHTILDHLGERFNAEVETITKAWSWGYAFRAVRGNADLSNHASGTAVDFNAPRHNLGARHTFTPAQVAAIRRILADLDGVVRWGGDYALRADEMHFEIVGNTERVAAVAARIRTRATTTATTTAGGATPKPPAKPDSLMEVIRTMNAYVFFEIEGHPWSAVANLLDRSWSKFPSADIKGQFAAQLTNHGVPWAWHADSKGSRLVTQPTVFGREVAWS
ncbi:MAG TPA: M15 family metallopeptidase [Rariglobus sp.]